MQAVVILARADLRWHWRAAIVLTLLIGLPAGLVLATVAGARRTDTAYGRFLGSTAAADAAVAASGPDAVQNVGKLAGYYADLGRQRGVVAVGPIIGVSATVPAHRDLALQLKVAATARYGRRVEQPKLVAGRMFDPARADEVVADHTVAKDLDLHVGSRVGLALTPPGAPGDAPPSRTTVRVVGIAVTRDNVIPINALASEPAFLASAAFLRTVPPAFIAYDAALVRLRAGTSVAEFRRGAEALLASHPETGGQLFVVDEHRQVETVERGIRPQATALTLFAVLVALTSVLILRQVLVSQMFVASADHPTLRALGLGRRELLMVGTARAAVTVVAGTIVAVVVAVALSPFTPIGPARLAEPNRGLEVNAAVLGLGALAALIVFGLLLVPQAWRLARGSGDAGATSGSRPARLVTALRRSGAPAPAIVGAQLALEPGHGRGAAPTRTTLAGAVVAVVAVTAAATFGGNLVRMVDTPRLFGQTWQVAADLDFEMFSRQDVGALLHGRPGVTGWTFGNHSEAIVDGRSVPAITLAPGHGRLQVPTLLEGRAPRRRDEIVLGSQTLDHVHRRVGDTVSVALQGEAHPRPLRIVGRAVFPFFGQGEVTPTGLGVGAALLDPHPRAPAFNFFLVSIAPGSGKTAQQARLVRAVRTSAACRDCRVATAQRPADVSNYARIERTPLVLAAVLAVLALGAVAQLLVTSIRRRRRDLALLRTLGFQRRQISTTIAWQASIVVLLALVIGLPVGVIAGSEAWRFFAGRLGVATDLKVPWLGLAVSIPTVLAVGNLLAIPPALAAARVRPATVLRSE